jgi:hypothetical protein
MGQFATERDQPGSNKAANDPVNTMLRDLQEARDLVKRIPASPQRDRIELLLTRTELQLKQQSANLGGVKPHAMSNEDYFKFMASFRRQAFDKDKYTFLENNLATHFLTSEQAAGIVRELSFDTDRIRAAVFLHKHVTDPEYFYRVLDVFSFETSKKTVTERIKAGK